MPNWRPSTKRQMAAVACVIAAIAVGFARSGIGQTAIAPEEQALSQSDERPWPGNDPTLPDSNKGGKPENPEAADAEFVDDMEQEKRLLQRVIKQITETGRRLIPIFL